MSFEYITKNVPLGLKMALKGEGLRLKIEIDLLYRSEREVKDLA